MMRVLVLGGGGMLGHKVFQVLSQRFDTWCTLRVSRTQIGPAGEELFGGERVLDGCDVTDGLLLRDTLERLRPHAVVNCVGVIKQRAEAQSAIPSLEINSLLPHRLVHLLAPFGARLIHISSDCVFSGQRGGYREDDFRDADDLYGRTKALGEVREGNVLTLRTSIIGRELKFHHSLLDWFLRQEGTTVRGFRRAFWSGVTNLHLAELIARLLAEHPELCGLFQVSSGRQSKHDLLMLLRDAYELDVRIEPEDDTTIDRSLLGDRLEKAIGYHPPCWGEMAARLAADPTPYHRWVRLRPNG
jgi:dTDP-4-dehydrorhamnose reductase